LTSKANIQIKTRILFSVFENSTEVEDVEDVVVVGWSVRCPP